MKIKRIKSGLIALAIASAMTIPMIASADQTMEYTSNAPNSVIADISHKELAKPVSTINKVPINAKSTTLDYGAQAAIITDEVKIVQTTADHGTTANQTAGYFSRRSNSKFMLAENTYIGFGAYSGHLSPT